MSYQHPKVVSAPINDPSPSTSKAETVIEEMRQALEGVE